MTPNVVAEWPPEREARREPNSKRSAAVGRSTPATGWAAPSQRFDELFGRNFSLAQNTS